MTSFAPCGIGFICVQLPCADASSVNNDVAITTAAEILASIPEFSDFVPTGGPAVSPRGFDFIGLSGMSRL